jgi:hypothetical protein
MTKLTKTAVTLATMTANADKPMAEVVALIVAAQHAAGFTDVTDKIAVGAYRWAVKNDKAPGKLAEKVKAAPKAKVVKEPKAKVAKAVSVATTRKARVIADVAATGKTVDEVESIRAANLAKIKAVHERMIARGDLPNTLTREIAIESEQPITIDEELEMDRDYPEFLTRDQLGEVLGEL